MADHPGSHNEHSRKIRKEKKAGKSKKQTTVFALRKAGKSTRRR